LIDIVFVRADRGLTLTLFLDVLSAFDSDLRQQLTAVSVRRLGRPVRGGRVAAVR
jgi:hypothetical protein